MDFYDVVRNRHSLRNYDPDKKVPRSLSDFKNLQSLNKEG